MILELGFQLAFERGYKQLLVESDSRITMSLIDKGESVLRDAGDLVFDIQDLAEECDGCMFLHVIRES